MSRARQILETHEEEINELVGSLTNFLTRQRKNQSIVGVGHPGLDKYEPKTKALVVRGQRGATGKKPGFLNRKVQAFKAAKARGAAKLQGMEQAHQQKVKDAGASKFSKWRQTDKKTDIYTGDVPSGAKTVGGQSRPPSRARKLLAAPQAQVKPRTLKMLGM